MLLEIGNFLLSFEREPFRLRLCRVGKPRFLHGPNDICLRSTAHAHAVTALTQADSSLRIDFTHHSLQITWLAIQ